MASDGAEQLIEVRRLALEIYGESLGPSPCGVLHVLSAVREGERWCVIKIDELAPVSACDFFVLNFWRAYGDAILTTAQVVRAEPQLSHGLQGPLALGLARYRSDVLGKREPAWCAIMTRSGSLPLGHRMFDEPRKYVVLSEQARAGELGARLGARAEVVGLEALDVRSAVAFMQARGARTILIETGPSTVGPLYSEPPLVEHLLLSRCEAAIDPAAVGGELPADAVLFAGLALVSDAARDEQSGRWRFQHWVRRAAHKR